MTTVKFFFLLQSGIIPPSFQPTSELFCKDDTHIGIPVDGIENHNYILSD